MDELDLELELARAQRDLALAKAEAASRQTSSSSGGSALGQLGLDVAGGIPRAFTGAADVIASPLVYGMQKLGLPARQFELSSLLGNEIQKTADVFGLQAETPRQDIISSVVPIGPGKFVPQALEGLASYVGGKVGETAGGTTGSFLGSILAPLLGKKAISTTARGIEKATDPTLFMLGNEEAIKRAAEAEILKIAGDSALQSVPTSSVPYTAAEILGTPSMAKYQSTIAQTQGGGDVLLPILAERESKIRSSMMDYGQERDKGILAVQLQDAAAAQTKAAEEQGIKLKSALKDLGEEAQQGDMALAMRDFSAEASAKKAASEGDMLTALGLSGEAKAVTSGERSTAVKESIQKRLKDQDDIAKDVWSSVDKNTELNARAPFKTFRETVNNFDSSTLQDLTGKAKEVLAKVDETLKSGGRITLKELQGLRAKAGRVWSADQSPQERKLMSELKDNIDSHSIAMLDGKAPWQANIDLQTVEKWKEAIATTKKLKQTFGEETVGEILRTRGTTQATLGSAALGKALSSMESAKELVTKFGKAAPEVTLARQQLLIDLEKSGNPTKFLNTKRDVFKQIFGSELSDVEEYVKSRGKPSGIAAYEKITDSTIPNVIFRDDKAAGEFMQRFAGTQVEKFARTKFTQRVLLEGGGASENLALNEKVAQKIFGKDYEKVKLLAKDLDAYSAGSKGKTAEATADMWKKLGKITEGQIGPTLFQNPKTAATFRRQFKGTETYDLVKGLFIKDQLLKGPSAMDNLNKNRGIAKVLFGSDLASIEETAKRYDKFRSPGVLEKAASKGQSITGQRRTAFGEYLTARGIIGAMQNPSLTTGLGSAIGSGVGSVTGGPIGFGVGAAVGGSTGYALSKHGANLQRKMDRAVAEFLANPQALSLAAKAPTKKNVKVIERLFNTLSDKQNQSKLVQSLSRAGAVTASAYNREQEKRR